MKTIIVTLLLGLIGSVASVGEDLDAYWCEENRFRLGIVSKFLASERAKRNPDREDIQRMEKQISGQAVRILQHCYGMDIPVDPDGTYVHKWRVEPPQGSEYSVSYAASLRSVDLDRMRGSSMLLSCYKPSRQFVPSTWFSMTFMIHDEGIELERDTPLRVEPFVDGKRSGDSMHGKGDCCGSVKLHEKFFPRFAGLLETGDALRIKFSTFDESFEFSWDITGGRKVISKLRKACGLQTPGGILP